MRFFRNVIFTSLIVIFSWLTSTAQEYEFEKMQFGKAAIITPRQVEKDWLFELQNLEDQFQGNSTYRGYLEGVKSQVEAKYKNKGLIQNPTGAYSVYNIDTPIVAKAFEGNIYSNGIPSDNAMGVSNDGIVVAAINTNIIFYDTKTDSLLKTISLSAFSDTLANIASHQYDPKVIYDYQQDKFILVYLAGSGSNPTSDIVVAFSSTNNPMDEWYLYSLPGNPLNDSSWTDYPAISLSNKELFITGNLLKTGNGSWQTSFKQSVIWQLDKVAGFTGKQLNVGLYKNIKHNEIPCRNIHPIRGGDHFYGPEMYFLSQRNFDIQNDTFFLIKTSNTLSDNDFDLSLDVMRSDFKYGMPPNAQQTNNRKLATNDSRVLGAFYQNGMIQFVGNTVDTLTGHASFYHGIFDPEKLSADIHLNIISDSILEFGYPNISYCGSNSSSQYSIISVNYSSSNVYPGFAAFFYQGNDQYSVPLKLKQGNAPIQVLFGTQRWGDYSASQPKYNAPGQVWVAGTFGKYTSGFRVYGTWIASLNSPKSDLMPIPPGKSMASKVYPNPAVNQKVEVEFVLAENREIKISISDVNGRRVADLYQGVGKQGRNVMSFSTGGLANGIYFVNIYGSNKLLKSHKLSVLQ